MRNLTDKQLREVFHFFFLERLVKVSGPEVFVLKGGVNFRFFFNSPRYSEDMDLDAVSVSVQTLKKNGYKILGDASFRRALQTFGIEDVRVNDPLKAKHTETTQRFRVRLVNVAGEEFPTKIEFSRRSRPSKDDSLVENILPSIASTYMRLSFACRHYRPEVAAVQKIQALGGRAETQARDVFDLFLLCLGGRIDKGAVKSILMKSDCERAIQAMRLLSFESYRGQVLEYLDGSVKGEYSTAQAWSKILGQVGELLDE